jgi:hypothetical protein
MHNAQLTAPEHTILQTKKCLDLALALVLVIFSADATTIQLGHRTVLIVAEHLRVAAADLRDGLCGKVVP